MPTLWITYAWADDDEGDYSYLVQELERVGVQVKYDKVALVPGRRLWDQIAHEITASRLDGWAYLVTARSVASSSCREELAYALDRALRTKGTDFPLIALVHGVPIEDIPVPLRTRLAVSLASADWLEQVKAGLLGQPASQTLTAQTSYTWRVHSPVQGNRALTAIEVRPRFGEISYWRIAVPSPTKIVDWGPGPAGTCAIHPSQVCRIEGGSGEIRGTAVSWFGTGDRLTPSMSAYVIIDGPLPAFVFFGPAADAFGPPDAGEVWCRSSESLT